MPLLSAIVDGEATPEQLMEVRPHLRHCTACRATVRELHATSAPLAALLPVALAPAAADNGHERAAGLLVRLYEAVTGGIHERAVSAALKLQGAAEAVSAGKLAAIAASAAALAGGGAVVVDSAAHADHALPERAHPIVQRTSARAAAPARLAVGYGRTTAPTAPVRRQRSEFARHDHARTAMARREFASTSTAAAMPGTAAPASPSTVVSAGSPEPSASRGEFASEFGG